jgi:hypothetical protein
MAYENLTKTTTLIAGQDLSAKQYRFMSLAPDGQIDPTGLGLEAEGILQNDPSAAGRAASVATLQGDISMCEAGGVVRVGRDMISDSVGRGIEAFGAHRVQAVAMTAAAAAGEIISVMLKKGSSSLQVTTTTTTTTTSTTTTTTA